ncbi:MAG: sporulation protein [Gracilibacter sp. BRH_c7a]|nr:MAG: sporulation protein [Gracilibacter sp. BRH_c7a]
MVVAAVLLLLKLFTYTVQEFLPVLALVMHQIFSALFPFIIAFILAFLVEPLVAKLTKTFNLKRVYASIIVLTLVILSLVLLLIFLGSRLYRELAELATSMPAMYEKTVTLIAEKSLVFQKYIELNPEIKNAINSSTQELLSTLQTIIKTGSMGLLSFLGALPGFMIVIVVATVATLIISFSFPLVKEWFFQRIKGKHNAKTRIVASNLGSALVGFLRAMTILVSVTAIVSTIGLILIGNKYALTLGILAGLLDLLPIIGPSLIFIPWTVVLLFTGELALALKVLIIYLVVTVIRVALEPKVMSQNIGIHPLPTLISIYVGLKLLGAAGLILGPALVVIYEAVRKAGMFKENN